MAIARAVMVLALLVPAVLTTPAKAEDANAADKTELRLGVLYHDAAVIVRPGRRDQLRVEGPGPDINLELLFASPAMLAAVGSPRPHIGMTVNPAGETSQAYLGLIWQVDLSDRMFVELGGGGAIHNGQTNGVGPDPAQPYRAANGEKLLGCRILFRGTLALGARIDEHYSLSLALGHVSNAYLCDPNPGLDTIGLRLGYRF